MREVLLIITVIFFTTSVQSQVTYHSNFNHLPYSTKNHDTIPVFIFKPKSCEPVLAKTQNFNSISDLKKNEFELFLKKYTAKLNIIDFSEHLIEPE